MFDLTGKTALVTGSSQGIGKAVAKCLAQHGAKVFVHGGTSLEKSKAASIEIENSVPVVQSLSEPDCAEKLFEMTGPVDILILNASVQVRCAWEDITEEDMELQLRVNLKSSFNLIQKYAPFMKEKGWGRIVTVGSVQQYCPHIHMPIYAASKCAQMSLVENFAKQLSPYGITVNNMAPGVIATPRNADALADEEYAKQVYAKIPTGYAGTPEDCAAGVLLLCSDEGRYIVGTDLIIDGGMHLK